MNATPDLYVVQIKDADGEREYEIDQAPSGLLALHTAVRAAVTEDGWYGTPESKPFSITVTPIHRNTVPERKWWKP